MTVSHAVAPLSGGIAFIGGGNMARSLIVGLLGAGVPAATVEVVEPQAAQQHALQQEHGVRVATSVTVATLDAQQYMERAQSVPGSWWTDWIAWIAPLSGSRRRAKRRLGHARYPVLEEAPGSYVKVRAS